MLSARTTPADPRLSSCVANSPVGATRFIPNTAIAQKKLLTVYSPRHPCPSQNASIHFIFFVVLRTPGGDLQELATTSMILRQARNDDSVHSTSTLSRRP